MLGGRRPSLHREPPTELITQHTPFLLPHTFPTYLESRLPHPLTMRITALILAAISAVSVSASPSWMPGQVAINDAFSVPGDNPLFFCADPKDDILEIKSVDLSPNPPSP